MAKNFVRAPKSPSITPSDLPLRQVRNGGREAFSALSALISSGKSPKLNESFIRDVSILATTATSVQDATIILDFITKSYVKELHVVFEELLLRILAVIITAILHCGCLTTLAEPLSAPMMAASRAVAAGNISERAAGVVTTLTLWILTRHHSKPPRTDLLGVAGALDLSSPPSPPGAPLGGALGHADNALAAMLGVGRRGAGVGLLVARRWAETAQAQALTILAGHVAEIRALASVAFRVLHSPLSRAVVQAQTQVETDTLFKPAVSTILGAFAQLASSDTPVLPAAWAVCDICLATPPAARVAAAAAVAPAASKTAHHLLPESQPTLDQELCATFVAHGAFAVLGWSQAVELGRIIVDVTDEGDLPEKLAPGAPGSVDLVTARVSAVCDAVSLPDCPSGVSGEAAVLAGALADGETMFFWSQAAKLAAAVAASSDELVWCELVAIFRRLPHSLSCEVTSDVFEAVSKLPAVAPSCWTSEDTAQMIYLIETVLSRSDSSDQAADGAARTFSALLRVVGEAAVVPYAVPSIIDLLLLTPPTSAAAGAVAAALADAVAFLENTDQNDIVDFSNLLQRICEALYQQPGPRARPHLLRALGHLAPRVAAGLTPRSRTQVIDILRVGIQNTNARTRAAAARALASFAACSPALASVAAELVAGRAHGETNPKTVKFFVDVLRSAPEVAINHTKVLEAILDSPNAQLAESAGRAVAVAAAASLLAEMVPDAPQVVLIRRLIAGEVSEAEIGELASKISGQNLLAAAEELTEI